MENFILIDLGTQADAVAAHVHGWPGERVLAWLKHHGDVRHLAHPDDRHLYRFASAAGVQTAFRFTERGELIIIQNHTTDCPS